MKLITKVLANRLRECLPEIISPYQSAFFRGRNIMDNILLGQEANQCIRRRNKGMKGYLSVKIDMSKAYDRIEWSFLREMLGRLGFQLSWVNKIMTCVESVSYVLKVNGNFSKVIYPIRGLRQGILCLLISSLFAKSGCHHNLL